ncbi:phosphoenolpyruvate carboxylase kinase [Carex littledalei]|uniref:Phosphoenolpyruvate carboxylase kinase n=1 Tax=Carex littledalei TaxID=544730 RepID=A0A833QGF7_9POAL|nr:phosphoenolpyruvate carboxylase kinase [Carex littledalei]
MSDELRRLYEIGAEIGRGRFGVVYHAKSRFTGEVCAVKSVDKTLLGDSLDRECAEMEGKLGLLAASGNDGVVQVHEVFEDENWIHIVMELCDGPDLLEWIQIRQGTPISEPEVAAVMTSLMLSLATCHRRGVAHRDIKPDNILFDSEGNVRLADFGSAASFTEERYMQGIVGTPYYVAPEVLRGEEYGEKIDVWSAGVVMYVMLAGGVPPFGGESAQEVFESVLRSGLRFPSRLFAGVSPLAKDLLRRMICREVSRRFSAEQVLRHPWIVSGGGVRPLDG